MKARITKTLIAILLIISVLNTMYSCGNREETSSCFPNQMISVQLNLNLPAYSSLLNIGGWMYISEQQSGTRGLIITRISSNEFKIYDRNAPHICPDSQTTLEVENGNIVFCRKDNAKWFLINGGPAAVSPYPLKQYFYNYNPTTNIINIYN